MKVFGYYYTGNLTKIDEKTISSIDVINVAFGRVNNNIIEEVPINTIAYEYIQEARNKYGVKIVLSLGGYGARGKAYSDIAFEEKNRKIFSENVLETIIKYNFDGIDLDWEYPGFETNRSVEIDRPNYTLLLKEVYNKVKSYNKDLIVSAALPAGPWGISRYEVAKIDKYLDYLHIMTYDLDASNKVTSMTPLYHNPLTTVLGCSVDESIKLYIEKGASINKLVVGIAFYGRKYKLENVNELFGNYISKSSIKYSNIKTNYIDLGCEEKYDDIAHMAYLVKDDELISYDSGKSVLDKINYTKRLNLAGIMFWEYASDSSYTLMEVIKKNK